MTFDEFSSPKLGPTRTYRERDSKLPLASEMRQTERGLKPIAQNREMLRAGERFVLGPHGVDPSVLTKSQSRRRPPERAPLPIAPHDPIGPRPVTDAILQQAKEQWQPTRPGFGLSAVAKSLGVLEHELRLRLRTDRDDRRRADG